MSRSGQASSSVSFSTSRQFGLLPIVWVGERRRDCESGDRRNGLRQSAWPTCIRERVGRTRRRRRGIQLYGTAYSCSNCAQSNVMTMSLSDPLLSDSYQSLTLRSAMVRATRPSRFIRLGLTGRHKTECRAWRWSSPGSHRRALTSDAEGDDPVAGSYVRSVDAIGYVQKNLQVLRRPSLLLLHRHTGDDVSLLESHPPWAASLGSR